MINPFTLQHKIHKFQQDVLIPLYTMHQNQESAEHDWLLAQTGRVIDKNESFLEELSRSSLVATVFAIVKFFGGADQLSNEDFDRFTSYVRDGGLKAMVKMLLAEEKEKTFLAELQSLPTGIQENAQSMLIKSSLLHKDYITGFFTQNYGSLEATPKKLIDNCQKSTLFIEKLAALAKQKIR
jgi:hypothetical protein